MKDILYFCPFIKEDCKLEKCVFWDEEMVHCKIADACECIVQISGDTDSLRGVVCE